MSRADLYDQPAVIVPNLGGIFAFVEGELCQWPLNADGTVDNEYASCTEPFPERAAIVAALNALNNKRRIAVLDHENLMRVLNVANLVLNVANLALDIAQSVIEDPLTRKQMIDSRAIVTSVLDEIAKAGG